MLTFHENPFTKRRVVPREPTEGRMHEEADSLFLKLHEKYNCSLRVKYKTHLNFKPNGSYICSSPLKYYCNSVIRHAPFFVKVTVLSIDLCAINIVDLHCISDL
jgi:hypothetical protein